MHEILRLEMHAHTCYSHDSLLTLKELAQACQLKKIDYIAITDHNTIQGALAFKACYSYPGVIVGEEIATAHGEIIGYFLSQEIPPGLTMAETIDEIRRQGGLVCVPHPLDARRGLGKELFRKILPQADIVECFNGRCLQSRDNEKAWPLVRQHQKAVSVGSDAHTAWELGRSHVRLQRFKGAEDFLLNLKVAEIRMQALPAWRNYVYSGGRLIKKFVMEKRCLACGVCNRSAANAPLHASRVTVLR